MTFPRSEKREKEKNWYLEIAATCIMGLEKLCKVVGHGKKAKIGKSFESTAVDFSPQIGPFSGSLSEEKENNLAKNSE